MALGPPLTVRAGRREPDITRPCETSAHHGTMVTVPVVFGLVRAQDDASQPPEDPEDEPEGGEGADDDDEEEDCAVPPGGMPAM